MLFAAPHRRRRNDRHVQIVRDGHVQILRLMRADKKNALTPRCTPRSPMR